MNVDACTKPDSNLISSKMLWLLSYTIVAQKLQVSEDWLTVTHVLLVSNSRCTLSSIY